jgi:hypothetical protein
MANAELTGDDNEGARVWAERAIEAARASGEPAVEANALVTLASSISDRRPEEALRLGADAAAFARRTGSADVMARVHQNGVAAAFAAENERPRLVRIERAREFAYRYGLRRPTIETFLLWHEMLALRWPEAQATTEETEDLYSAWAAYLHLLMTAGRLGPQGVLARSAELSERGRGTQEPQWAVPWLAWHALLAAWAQDAATSRAAYAETLRSAAWHVDPALALTVLARGLSVPAALAFLERDVATLERMDGALAGVEGNAGERDAIAAFRTALDGGDAREPFERAAVAYRDRGLRLTIAVHLWALASRGAVTPEWTTTTMSVADELRSAGAGWLASEILRLSAAPPMRAR